jgi:hypothetical protein
MKRFWIALSLAFLFIARLQASSLITNPVVMVTPLVLDFGSVRAKNTTTNTLLISNAGGGKLVGKATVAPPFKIISGDNYTLRENAAQVVTITYTPSHATNDSEAVNFSGGGGAKVQVTGRLKAEPPGR